MYSVDYRFLRPQKAAALEQLHCAPVAIRETPGIWVGRNATILPVRKADQWGWAGYGGVIDESGNGVPQSETPPMVRLGAVPESAEYRDQKVVYCGYLMTHWGHFLVDSVSRLWYFLEQDPTIDKYIFTLEENATHEVKDNYREFLVLLKIWDKVEFLTKPVKYREVVVPELGFVRNRYESPKYAAVFERIADNITVDPAWTTADKIFFSRTQLKKENPLEFGFEVIDNFLKNNGYTILYPEKLSLSQMIFYIRNAKVVAAISGTPPHNMLFGHQGQHLQIFERCAMNNDYQVIVNRLKALQVTYIDANFALYTVRMTGPFIMGYNQQLEQFARENGNMLPPDPEYCSKTYLKNCFVRYMKSYEDLYHFQWFMEQSLFPETHCLYEAYSDSAPYFQEYLNGSIPFLPHHYLRPYYWKQLVKRLIKRQ